MNLLFLVHRVPYPPDKGDRIRTFHLLKYLARHAAVHVACLADEPVGEEVVAALGRLCKRVAVVPLGRWTRWARGLASLAGGGTVTEGAFRSPALERILRDWTKQTRFDIALASASSMVPYLRSAALRDVPDLIDVDSQKWFDYAHSRRGPLAWLYRTEGQRLRRLERDLPTWARGVILVSEGEAELYRTFGAPGPVYAVTNGVDLDYFHFQPEASEPACVFVGALDYLPNVEGACWFCEEVWPVLHRRRPQARFYLVGRRPTPAVRRLAGRPGVELVGQVPDVRPYLGRAAVAVVPLRIARGVQNKVLEALAMGKATVASPESLAGLRARPGTHLLAASSASEWVEAVDRLLDDEPLRRQFGAAGRRYVEEHHCWDRCLETLGPILGLSAANGAAGPAAGPALLTAEGPK